MLGLCFSRCGRPRAVGTHLCLPSATGNDANDCGHATPCKTFQRAHDNSLANGEITALDPGGYGVVTITKGISIINDGVGEAGMMVSGGLVGIPVNAGANVSTPIRRQSHARDDQPETRSGTNAH